MSRDYWDRWLDHCKDGETTIDPFFLKEVLQRGISTILDIGSGHGKKIESLAKLGFRVSCVDYSREATHILKNVSKNPSIRHMNVIRANLLSLPFRFESFGAVTSYNVMNFFLEESQRKKAFEEMIRVLKSGGIMLIVAMSSEDRGIKSGKPLGSRNYRLPGGICLHYYIRPEIEIMLKDMNVHRLTCFQTEDRSHDEPHIHSLIYALASKPVKHCPLQ